MLFGTGDTNGKKAGLIFEAVETHELQMLTLLCNHHVGKDVSNQATATRLQLFLYSEVLTHGPNESISSGDAW
jgi:hypothetical protein